MSLDTILRPIRSRIYIYIAIEDGKEAFLHLPVKMYLLSVCLFVSLFLISFVVYFGGQYLSIQI